jgi:hypothetical protein
MTKTKGTLKINKGLMKKVRFSGTKHEDLHAYYKAYLMGAFERMPEINDNEGLSRDEFEFIFSTYVNINGLLTVTFFGFHDGVELPVGVGFFWPRGRILQISDLTWFPWATPRQIFENCMNYYDGVRKTTHTGTGKKYKILEFAHKRDEKFFDRLEKASILEKIGNIDGLYPDGPAILYVTKEEKE